MKALRRGSIVEPATTNSYWSRRLNKNSKSQNIAALTTIIMALTLTACQREQKGKVEMHSPHTSGLATSISGRKITIHNGTIAMPGASPVNLPETSFQIPPCTPAVYSDEPFELVKLDDTDARAWHYTPQGTQICTLPLQGLLLPETLCIKPHAGDPCDKNLRVFDYHVDPKWGIVLAGKKENLQSQKVYLDYEVKQRQIYTVYVSKTKDVQLVAGKLERGAPSPAELPQGATAIMNIIAPPANENLSSSDILPITSSHPPGTVVADEFKPLKAIKKLKTGLPLNICFIGDSVTCSACATNKDHAFPALLMQNLRKMYSGEISYSLFCKGGSDSSEQFKKYLALAKTSEKQTKPDLIVVEFVNDLRLRPAEIEQNYKTFVEAMHAQGTEVIVCLPHLVHPSYYGYQPQDWAAIAGKAYYSVITDLSKKCKFAVADVAFRSKHAAVEGLKPELLLADGLNHPNDRGHAIYAEELIKCFR